MANGILNDQLPASNLGLKGATPGKRAGALETSQLHAQEINPTIMKAEHSVHDLDGKVPASNYRDNAPEGASF